MSDPERTTSGRPSRRTVLRDVASFILGWGLIYQQAVFVDPEKVNGTLIWAAVSLLGVPGASELLLRAGTALRPSATPPPPSPSGSPSPATSSGGGE